MDAVSQLDTRHWKKSQVLIRLVKFQAMGISLISRLPLNFYLVCGRESNSLTKLRDVLEATGHHHEVMSHFCCTHGMFQLCFNAQQELF